MAEETQYTAKNGIVSIATANSNLDGSGTLGSIITASSNGTLIKNVYIKATGNTTEGMIRLYVFDGTNSRLIKEIVVPAITCSGTTPTFEIKVQIGLSLKSGFILKASTEKAETFNIIAEALDWTYYGSSVRTDTTQFTTKNGIAQLTTANTNRDGSGTIYDVYTAGSSGTYKGSSIKDIILKDTQVVGDSMIRLYINNGSTKYLFKESYVPAKTGSDLVQFYKHVIEFENDFDLQADYKISASTQTAETYGFEITISGNDWKYLA